MSVFFFLIFCVSLPAFLVGMIVPAVFSRFFKEGVTRGKIAKLLGAIMFGSLFASIAMATPIAPSTSDDGAYDVAVVEDTVPNIDADVLDAENGVVEDGNSSRVRATVVSVVDGDTVKVDIAGIRETIRIIGINTPETVDPRKPVECFGKEASARAKELLTSQTIELEADATQGEQDKYGRLLRYVFLPDGSNFGKTMITEGFAYEYTYSTPYSYQQEYKDAQADATKNERGLWASGACNDGSETLDTPTSTVEPTSTSNSTVAPAVEAPVTPSEPSAASNPADSVPSTPPSSSCSCSSNTYNCSDFSTHAAAQAVYDCCMAQVGSDIHRLDGNDNDGLACESLR
ncbi:MAG: thermonuclease family protein [Patescibacteria group bacterium]